MGKWKGTLETSSSSFLNSDTKTLTWTTVYNYVINGTDATNSGLPALVTIDRRIWEKGIYSVSDLRGNPLGVRSWTMWFCFFNQNQDIFMCALGMHVSSSGKLIWEIWRGSEPSRPSGEASAPWFCRYIPRKTQTQFPEPRQPVYRAVTAIHIATQITFALWSTEWVLQTDKYLGAGYIRP